MLGCRTSLALAGALAAGLVGMCPPAHAGYGEYWSYDERPASMPAPADRSRTIESATGFVADGAHGQATVTLGAEPGGPAAPPDVHLVYGTRDAGECAPVDEIVVPATTRTVSLAGDVHAPAGTAFCSYVAVTDAGSAVVLDRLDGRVEGVLIVDPTTLLVHAARHSRVPVGRWSSVTVSIRLDKAYERVRVHGVASHGLQVRKVVQSDVGAGRLRVRLPVRLDAHSARRLVIRVDAVGEPSASSTTGTLVHPRR